MFHSFVLKTYLKSITLDFTSVKSIFLYIISRPKVLKLYRNVIYCSINKPRLQNRFFVTFFIYVTLLCNLLLQYNVHRIMSPTFPTALLGLPRDLFVYIMITNTLNKLRRLVCNMCPQIIDNIKKERKTYCKQNQKI